MYDARQLNAPKHVTCFSEASAAEELAITLTLTLGLGKASAAKQLAVLLSMLGKSYIFLEGKDKFGF